MNPEMRKSQFGRGLLDGEGRRKQHPEALILELKDAVVQLKRCKEYKDDYIGEFTEYYWRGRIAGLVSVD